MSATLLRGLSLAAAQRLLLRAAAAEGESACAAWAQWRRAGGDLDQLDPRSARLLAMIYRKLEAGQVDDPDLARLRGFYRHAWVSNQRLLSRLGQTLPALTGEGIATMVLGGAALSATHVHDAGARRLDDAGVLVAVGEATRALAVFRACGWTAPGPIDPARALRSRHAVALSAPGETPVTLHARALAESASDEDFWSGAVAVALGSTPTRAPGPSEQLLYACAGVMQGGLLWAADAAAILRGGGVDWGRLVNGAASRRLGVTVATSLAVVSDVLEAPIPPEVIDELGALPSTARERLCLRLSSRPGRVTGYVRLWDLYRRNGPEGGFLRYVADATGVPSRRALAVSLVRHATSRPRTAAVALRRGVRSR